MSEQRHISQVEIISTFCSALEKLGCKGLNQRQMNAIIEAANIIHAEINKPTVTTEAGEGMNKWLASDTVGLSSQYMAYVLAPLAGVRQPTRPHSNFDRYPHPHDPGDFWRCVNLLKTVPELRPHLSALADASKHGPEWATIIAHWDELEALLREEEGKERAPKLYEKLSSLLKEAEKKGEGRTH